MAVTKKVRLPRHLQGKTEFECLPVAVPHAAGEDVIAADCWVDEVHFNNTTAGALTITVSDKQGSPVVLLNKSIAANDFLHINMGGTHFPGGLTWQGSAAGIVGYVKGRF